MSSPSKQSRKSSSNAATSSNGSNNAPLGPPTAGGVVTDLDEKDVLFGRGKRVSEWPGNVFFRQIVNKHRAAYNEAQRNDKTRVALKVVEEIKASGARFLREDDITANVFEEVDFDRVVEKSCQALREKFKSLPPPPTTAIPPFDGKKKVLKPPRLKNRKNKLDATIDRNRAPSAGGGKRKKLQNASDSESDDDDDDDSAMARAAAASHAAIMDEINADDLSSDDDHELLLTKKRKVGPIARLRDWNADDMLHRLKAFTTQYGHAAVPPYWSEDQDLADWCVAQRHVWRETGTVDGSDPPFRPATEVEESLLEELALVKFVFDYDAWHWERQYDRLKAGAEATGKSQSFNEATATWLFDQRQRALEGRLADDKIATLRKLGVYI